VIAAGSFRRSHVPAAGVVTVGCVLLAGRAWSAPLAGSARPIAGVLGFGAILVASLAVPVRREPAASSDVSARLGAPVALAVGLLALAGATFVAGRPVPLVVAAWTLPLSLLAAVAEEALFRRVAYAELARWGAVAAVLGSALLFAVIHVPLYGLAAFPVDLGAGLVFGWQRWATGSWVASAGTHAAANLVAVLR
jgi:membrane protease YdiL (CAAX protease family)